MSASEHDGGDPTIGAQRGKFRVEKKLGQGGMGALYVATAIGSERKVLLEIMDADAAGDAEQARRFLQEAKALTLLAHENVVRCESLEHDANGPPYLVFEMLEGRDLEAQLALERRLPLARALRIAVQAGAGLAEAHKRGILHRDVRPATIFLQHTEDGRDAVKVVGFGLGKMPGGTGLVGAIHWASPEQLSRSKTVDARTDVYSLGAVLYRALTGHPPFENDDPRRLVELIAEAELPDLLASRPDAPPRLAEVIRRACAKRPQDRFPKMSALVRELEAIDAGAGRAPKRVTSEPVVAKETRHHDGGGMVLTEPRPQPSTPPPARPSGGTNTWAMATIAVLLVGTSALAGYALGEGAGDDADEVAPEVAAEGPTELAREEVEPAIDRVAPEHEIDPAGYPPAEMEEGLVDQVVDEAPEEEIAVADVAPPSPSPSEQPAPIEPAPIEPAPTDPAPADPEPIEPAAIVAAAPGGPDAMTACAGIWRFRDARGAYRLAVRAPVGAGECGTARFESLNARFFGNCTGTITTCAPTATSSLTLGFTRTPDEDGPCVFPGEWEFECTGDTARAHLGPRRGTLRLARARR